MSKRHPVIWDAEPHTVAKIEILKAYLDAWFRILGSSRRYETILYIDGFAGPGRYRNHHEGSPVAAIKAATTALATIGPRFIAGNIHCAFIEGDRARFNELSDTINSLRLGSVRITLENTAFVDGVERIRRKIPEPFSGDGPLFVFADPFGATQIPFTTFAACMESETAELLINLDADGIARIFSAENNHRETQLTDLFGTDDWRQKLTATDLRRLSVQILDLYKARLRTLPGHPFVWSFAMRGRADLVNYHLVFATRHPLGMEKMKEAMRAIDSTGSYSFSDAHREQQALFRDDDADVYAKALFDAFVGQTVAWETVRAFALTETPFTNPKAMLAVLEHQQKLLVETHGEVGRRRGTFSEEKVRSLRFVHFGASTTQQELGL